MKYLGAMALSALTIAVLPAPGRAVTLTTAQKCEAKKLLAAATYGKCRLKADRKSLVSGTPVDYTKCDTNFLSAYAKAETNAAGACPVPGDAAAVQTRISGDTAAVTAETGGTEPTALRRLPASGETTSLVAGDDGAIRAGAALRYVDNGDGTITDITTGLMWEKKDDADGSHDKDNTYAWAGVCGTSSTLCGADADCGANGPCNGNDGQGTNLTIYGWIEQLNSGGGFAGHTDWRIPNRKELESILDAGIYNPATDAAFNTNCGGQDPNNPDCIGCWTGNPGCTVLTCSCTMPDEDGYWTSSPYAVDPSYAWSLSFYDGTVSFMGRDTLLHVRAVRGGL